MIALDQAVIPLGERRLGPLSLSVPEGAYAVLMGATGSGKTSILESLLGLRPLLAGRATVGGRDVTRERPGNRGIGYVPQDGALFPTMNVAEHLAFAPRLRRWRHAEIVARVDELATELELGPLLERLPQGLSGGERQRVALGRALACRPAALCLDEPLAALDEGAQERLRELLASLHARARLTVLHVTHSRAEAERLGTLRLRLEAGVIGPDTQARLTLLPRSESA
jgi:ABC-type sugar transport system ATPase subunit